MENNLFSDLKFVVRIFRDDQYLYSVHTTSGVLDELVSSIKNDGCNVKVIAYREDVSDLKSEV